MAALRLISNAMQARPKALRGEIDRLLRLQHPDGGWPQTPGDASDAHATGQALYALSLAGVMSTRKEVVRAAAYLVSTQKDDGSWQMIPRSHPGAKPMTSPIPITYNGSAWATMGLMRLTSADLHHQATATSLRSRATETGDFFDR
jgi:hypothetical protein